MVQKYQSPVRVYKKPFELGTVLHDFKEERRKKTESQFSIIFILICTQFDKFYQMFYHRGHTYYIKARGKNFGQF